MLRLALYILGLVKFSLCQDITNIEDIQVLSELPLERLLTLKRGFMVEKEEYQGNSTEADGIESRTIPYALALQTKAKLKDRGGHGDDHYYYEEHSDKDGKSKKIQTIFQLSITSLAFLAFGGYLLCLLIHAINAKQTTNTNAAAIQTFATFVAQKIQQVKNKKRPRKRRKNLKVQRRPTGNLKVQKRPNRNLKKPNKNKKRPIDIDNSYVFGEVPRPIRPREKRGVYESGGFLITEEKMYEALVDLSEAYTKYNTLDYLQYNNTFFIKS